MSLALFGHPFSSYTQKVLIALWADGTPFEYRMLDQEHPENFEELKRHSPFGLFPLLLDDGRPVIEKTAGSPRAKPGDVCGSSTASSTCT
jgi:glutathione S-transferase